MDEACSTCELSVKSCIHELANLIPVILSATAGSLGIAVTAWKLVGGVWVGEF